MARHHHQQQQLNSNPNGRRPSTVGMMENNPIGNEEYDYDYYLMKLLEQERHFMINQVCIFYFRILVFLYIVLLF